MFVYAIYDHPFDFDASTSCGLSFFFLGRRRLSSPNSSNPALLSSHRAYLCLHDPEAADDPPSSTTVLTTPPCQSNQTPRLPTTPLVRLRC